MAVKLATVRAARSAGRDTVVVANGEEGEPASVKDRWLLRHRPHLVLDGLRLAAQIVGARHAHVYVSDPGSARAVEAALAEVGAGRLDGLTVSVRTVDPGYVAGEETAAVRAINGGPAKPTDKPPRTFEEGVGGLPTLVSNVETLANLPYIQRNGAAGVPRSRHRRRSPGTFLATVTGGGRRGRLSTSSRSACRSPNCLPHKGLHRRSVRGVLMGGYFAGLLNTRGGSTLTLDHEIAARHRQRPGLRGGLGASPTNARSPSPPPCSHTSTARTPTSADPASTARPRWPPRRAPCATDRPTADDVARLQRWSVVLRGRGACATLDAACNIAASLLTKFADEVARHLDGSCQGCGNNAYAADKPFEVKWVRESMMRCGDEQRGGASA